MEILWSQPYSIKYRSFQNYKDLLYIFSNAAKCKDFLNFIMNGSFQQRDLKIVSWQHKRGASKKSHNGISWKNGIKLSCNNDLFSGWVSTRHWYCQCTQKLEIRSFNDCDITLFIPETVMEVPGPGDNARIIHSHKVRKSRPNPSHPRIVKRAGMRKNLQIGHTLQNRRS